MNNRIIWSSEPSGWCPVQGYGWIDDIPFFFYSRGKKSELWMAGSKDTDCDPMMYDYWIDDNKYFVLKDDYDDFMAGYIDTDTAKNLVEDFIKNLD